MLATHLTEVVKSHAHELLTRQEVKNLLDNLKQRVPAAGRGSRPDAGQAGRAAEGDAEPAPRARAGARPGDDPRNARRLRRRGPRTSTCSPSTSATRWPRTICKQYVDDQDRLWCVTLDPALEELINGHLDRSERGTTNTMPPQTAQQVVQQIADKAAELTQTGPERGDPVQPADPLGRCGG